MTGYTDQASYDSYGYEGSYAPPHARNYLTGPGSTATAGGYYARSYASENERGGIYTHDVNYVGTNESIGFSYDDHGAACSISEGDTYIDDRVRTPGSPIGDGTRYGPYTPFGYGDLEAIDIYGVTRTTTSGGATCSAGDSVTTEQFSSGYTISYHSHSTSESYGGHFVPGSQGGYSYATIIDPYGYTTPFGGGSSGYYDQA